MVIHFSSLIISFDDGLYCPVVEYGRPAVKSAESLCIHASLAKLLSSIHHDRIGVQPCAHHESRQGTFGTATKEVAGNALLIVVFQEIEHLWQDIIHGLPLARNVMSWTLTTHDVAQTVVHAHLIIQIVKSRSDIRPIKGGIVHLANNDDVRIGCLELTNSVCLLYTSDAADDLLTV